MPRTGRPPVDDPRRNVRSVHLSDDELRQLEAAAQDAGQPTTAYIRVASVAAAQRRLRRSARREPDLPNEA